ncbi:MAG TPA: hypothetical protein VHJ17_02865 [Thermomonospora sp.]|nr:hypothetical protein [Thermomonospora sp.]
METGLAAALTLPFEVAARLRRARAVHPRGRSYRGTLVISAAGPPPPGEYDVVARLSKATSTPGGAPDVLGVAVRVPAAAGPVDLLFATTGLAPGARHVLCVRRSFLAGAYTTLLPYDVGGHTRVLGLVPADPDRHVPTRLAVLDAEVTARPLRFTLVTAGLISPWRPSGTLEIHTPIPEDSEGTAAFDPQLNNIPGLHPTGPLQTIRRLAYARSRRGRHQPW